MFAIGIILAIGIFAFLIYASFNISSGIYLQTFSRKKTDAKQVMLTFDDGPHPVHTPAVLDILKKYEVKAAFFVIGKNIAGNEDILKRMLAEGHTIGNHSFSHGNTFPLLRPQKMADDLMQCERAAEKIIGQRTTWFRPPFGVTNPYVARAIKMRNYRVAGWSIRSLDTLFNDKNKPVRRVVKRLKPGAIILLHDNRPNAPYITEQILLQAKEKGYDFANFFEPTQ